MIKQYSAIWCQGLLRPLLPPHTLRKGQRHTDQGVITFRSILVV